MMTASQFKCQSLVKKLSVTSVLYSDGYVYAGVGGDLCLFECVVPIKLKSNVNVLKNAVIHGICQNTEKSGICVFGGKQIAILKANFRSSDCCICVHKWAESDLVLRCQWVEGHNQLIVLTAHNVLTVWDTSTGTNLSKTASVEKCILYCGTLLTNVQGWLDTVVVVGTVFQQIVVWAVMDKSTDDRPVLHKLSGHKGVIFSVTYNNNLRLISSTSDDRSVRVWSVASPKSGVLSADDWKDASVTLRFTIFGHTSRVWQSYILADKKIISIGEDSMLCVWREGGECVWQSQTHQGAGLWCLDVDENQGLMVTGGADGGVSLWPLCPTTNLRTLPTPSHTPRRVTLIKDFQVLIITEHGDLQVYTNHIWSTVFTDSRFSSYCLMEVSPSKQLIGLASINGHIVIIRSIDFVKVVDIQVTTGRIFSMHWLSDDNLLTCHNHGKLLLWKISHSGLKKYGEVHLPASKERWTTSAVMFDNTVVYGDRAGSIHSSPVSCFDPITAVQTTRRAHSRLGVCSLSLVAGHVWSTGRDATVNQFAIRGHCLTLVCSSRLPVDWAAQVLCSDVLGTTILCFHESSVVLWSIIERRKLASLQCGGGHRSWSCQTESGQFCFTYLKHKTAHILQLPLSSITRPLVMDGFHRSEINSLALVDDSLVVSGGEDGTLRLSRFGISSWNTVAVEHNHLSSVRSVLVCKIHQQKYIISAGGRAQIKMWRINSDPSASLTELGSVMLREERRGRHWQSMTPEVDPEIRYMDLDALQQADSLHVLAASSDGCLRIFQMDLKSHKFVLHKILKIGSYCLLRVASFQLDITTIITVTTATDGSVAFSCLDEEVVTFMKEYPHQSGVNGLSVSREGMGVLVATGGDDNTLAVRYCCFNTFPLLSAATVSSWANSTLHSSVITGVQILKEGRLLCSGGDHRVTLLTWSVTNDSLNVHPMAQYCCSVPDIKGLTILQADMDNCIICVYGNGVEVMELKPEKISSEQELM